MISGISYLPEPVETKMREKIKIRQATAKEDVAIPEDNKAFVEEMW